MQRAEEEKDEVPSISIIDIYVNSAEKNEISFLKNITNF